MVDLCGEFAGEERRTGRRRGRGGGEEIELLRAPVVLLVLRGETKTGGKQGRLVYLVLRSKIYKCWRAGLCLQRDEANRVILLLRRRRQWNAGSLPTSLLRITIRCQPTSPSPSQTSKEQIEIDESNKDKKEEPLSHLRRSRAPPTGRGSQSRPAEQTPSLSSPAPFCINSTSHQSPPKNQNFTPNP